MRDLRYIALFLLGAVVALSQTAKFPGAIAADGDLLIGQNRCSTTLNGAITSADTTITVVSTSTCAAPGAITIEDERICVTSKTGTTFTVCTSGRGFDGSTAASHADTLAVVGNIIAWHHNANKEEIKAIEGQLGVNMSIVGKLATAGSAGVTPFNQGTATTSARSDHQHFPPFVISTTQVSVNAAVTTEQNLMVLTIPAGTMNVANRFSRIHAAGNYTTGTSQTPTLTFRTRLCTVSGCATGTNIELAAWTSASTTASAANKQWHTDLELATITTGATGTVEGHGAGTWELGATGAVDAASRLDQNTAPTAAIDLTAQLFLQFTVRTSTGATTNSIRQRAGSIFWVN